MQKLVRGGDDAAILRVHTTVCHHCGERYLPMEAVRALEQARRDLERGEVSQFRALGRLLIPRAGGPAPS